MTEGALIIPLNGKTPKIHETAFVAPGVVVIGDVEIGPDSSIWYGVVIRGDVGAIRIGARSNIQDNSVVHATEGYSVTTIGDDVLVGHSAIIHGCTIEDGGFVGMGATVLDNAIVEGGAMVAANALVGERKHVKRGELWAGVPAKAIKTLTDAQMAGLKDGTDHYVAQARNHAAAVQALKK